LPGLVTGTTDDKVTPWASRSLACLVRGSMAACG
jgi:hypothetical protein